MLQQLAQHVQAEDIREPIERDVGFIADLIDGFEDIQQGVNLAFERKKLINHNYFLIFKQTISAHKISFLIPDLEILGFEDIFQLGL